MKASAEGDPFTQNLINIMRKAKRRQKCFFGIHRSDYMLHDVAGDDRKFLQVELNTIASSFGALSTKIAEMFRSLLEAPNVPKNIALEEIVSGLYCAHMEYIRQMGIAENSAAVMMMVQPNERNYADQVLLTSYHSSESYLFIVVRPQYDTDSLFYLLSSST